MKTIIKKITLMLLSNILAAGMIFGALSMLTTGCGDSGDDKTPMVEEQDQFYDDWVNGITVYKGSGVTGQQVEDMIEGFDNWLSNSQKIRFANHITEIHVTKNSGQISHEGDILHVGYDANIADIKSYLFNEGLLAKNQQKDGIMVVVVNGTVDAVMSAKLNRYNQPDQMMNEKQV